MVKEGFSFLFILMGVSLIVAQEPVCRRFEAEMLEQMTHMKTEIQEVKREMEILRAKHRGQFGLGNDIPVPYMTPPLQVADLEKDGWRMVFRASAGNGNNAYNAFTTGSETSDVKPNTMARSYSSHYRDPGIDSWGSHNIKYAKFALFKDTREVAYVIFNGEGSTYMDWFSSGRVIDSSWSDLTSRSQFNLFSITAVTTDVRLHRRFMINRKYAGCANDVGHVAVIEREGPCLWDKHPVYPQFLYSEMNAADFWERRQFGRADFMAIFVYV